MTKENMSSLKSNLEKESRSLGLDFDLLKSGGFIKQTQKDLFTVRLRCPGGTVTSDKLRIAAEIAEKWGRGEAHLSVRQSVEIPYVHYESFQAIKETLAKAGWSVASCGPRVRVPTACAGCSYNPNGLTDTQKLCAEVDRKYFGVPTEHHKFKIAFSGCPIDCFRTREMDLGFQGVMEPELVEDLCIGCELCIKGCDEKALSRSGSIPARDLSRCIACGDCVKVCPVNAMTAKRTGWLARAGGKHGKHPYFAYEVANFLTDDQVFSLIEKTLEWYRENGVGRERIGQTIDRLGIDKYIDEIILPLGLPPVRSREERKKFYTRGNFYGN